MALELAFFMLGRPFFLVAAHEMGGFMRGNVVSSLKREDVLLSPFVFMGGKRRYK